MKPISEALYRRLQKAPGLTLQEDQWGEMNLTWLDGRVYRWGIDRKAQSDWIDAVYTPDEFLDSRHGRGRARTWFKQVSASG